MHDDVQCIFKKRPGIPYCAKHEHMYDSDEEVEPPKSIYQAEEEEEETDDDEEKDDDLLDSDDEEEEKEVKPTLSRLRKTTDKEVKGNEAKERELLVQSICSNMPNYLARLSLEDMKKFNEQINI